MASLDDLNNIPEQGPSGMTPGVHLDGDSGYITAPADSQNHEDIARILEASRLNPEDFIVDWSKQVRLSLIHI